MENTTPPSSTPDQTPQTEVSPQASTPEQKPIIRSKDILNAPDVATALAAYHQGRKERYGDKPSPLH